jgi:hypothetical protein
MKLIHNAPAFQLTDTRGRPVVDASRQPVTESVVTFLLTLAGDPGFIAGLDYIASAEYVRLFCEQVSAQQGLGQVALQDDRWERIVKVLRAPRLRIESTTLHCYHDLIQAILNATEPPEVAEAPDQAAE